jgi:hypothetical protein
MKDVPYATHYCEQLKERKKEYPFCADTEIKMLDDIWYLELHTFTYNRSVDIEYCPFCGEKLK